MGTDFYIGKQPILDSNMKIYAYELLFRQPGEIKATVLDNSAATARVLINAIQNIGLEKLLQDKYGFINADESIIMEGMLEILPNDKFVIEVLETTKVTDELIEKIKEYKEKGYTFALDDLVLEKEYYEMFEKLFPIVDVIKVDYMFCDKEQLKKNMVVFKKMNVKMLAEKVETIEDYEICKSMGFDLFQGYYFAKPEVISEKSIDPSKAATIQLINMIRKDADAVELEKMIKNYPDLYINLLKFMNSAAFFTRGEIKSIKHAIAMIGRENLAKWLYLILYAGPNNDSFDNPVLHTAQVRGRTMEKLCESSKICNNKEGTAYLAGLISLMDVVFNKELHEVLKEFNIEKEIKEAILSHDGEIGRLLKLVIDYEKDEYEKLVEELEYFDISVESFHETILDSFEYADKLCRL